VQRISRDRLAVAFDRRTPPVATVRPGEVFVVETEDARGGRTRTPETTTADYLLEMRRTGWYGNPVTGPIYVEEAEPGDTLAVHVQELTCDDLGWIPVWPFLFHFEDLFDRPATILCEIADGHVHLGEYARIPVRPMIGTIGTAPAVEAILSGGMGRHGGNLDAPEVCAGSTIYLPVEVEGALLALGDCHAVQSDGELASVEMRSDVTIRCEVIKGRSPQMTWPRIETPDAIVTVAVGRPLEEALQAALRDMILWVQERTGLTTQDAYALVGVAGHARPGQAQVGLYSMRCIMPRAHLPESWSGGA
jgi:acetamidase/formamidase